METTKTKITVTKLEPYFKGYLIVTYKSDESDSSNTEEEYKLILRQENVFNHLNMNLPAECILEHDKYFHLRTTCIKPI